MEENKVALRKRAEKLAKRLEREIGTGKAIGLIFRELVAVRDQSRVKIKYSTRPPLEIPND